MGHDYAGCFKIIGGESQHTMRRVCKVYANDKDDLHNGPPHEANAARIVACVNALAGITDPAAFMAAHRKLVEAARSIDKTVTYLGLVGSNVNDFRIALSGCEQNTTS